MYKKKVGDSIKSFKRNKTEDKILGLLIKLFNQNTFFSAASPQCLASPKTQTVNLGLGIAGRRNTPLKRLSFKDVQLNTEATYCLLIQL